MKPRRKPSPEFRDLVQEFASQLRAVKATQKKLSAFRIVKLLIDSVTLTCDRSPREFLCRVYDEGKRL